MRCVKINNIILSGTGEVLTGENTVLDMADSARIYSEGCLRTNAYALKGSKAECLIEMHDEAVMRVIGNFSFYYNTTVKVLKKGELILGSGYINSGSVIACQNKITIGKGVFIARNVHIYDSDFHSLFVDGIEINPAKPINIGNHVWIGVGCTILKGVSIGRGSVIGANSVVTRDVPEDCLAVGNPARVVKENIEWR